jgi:hypothetical protein
MGALAVRLAIQLDEDIRILPTELVVRESTAHV